MAIWTYGDAHNFYPVEDGDIWQVGNHKFICGDLEANTRLFEEIKKTPPDFMYVDPPWNNGIAQGFRTKAGVDGDKGRKVDFTNLLKILVKMAKDLEIPIYMEGSMKEQVANEQAIRQFGVEPHSWDISYANGLPSMMFAGDFRKKENAGYPEALPTSDVVTDEASLISYYKAKLVVDPCAGMGITARAAETAGVASITNELSKYRVARAISEMVTFTNLQAKKL